MPKSNEYWKRRMEMLEEAHLKKGESYLKDLDNQYRKASWEIDKQISTWYRRFADNNEITMTEARKLLSAKELKEFKWDVNEYIKYGEENALDQRWMKELENASTRVHVSRLEALKLQMQQQAEVLYGNQLDDVDNLLRDIYTNGYYHTAFEIQKGFNIGWDLHSINDNQLDKILSKPWSMDGKTFSNRIWTNKQDLIANLQTHLTQAVITGKGPDQVIKDIAKLIGTHDEKPRAALYKAGRLVMTETAAFASAAQKDCFNDLDVKEFEIVATLDNSTSAICQDLDGTHMSMKDYAVGVTAPPFHAWCRTVTVPYFDDEFSLGERAARGEDGKTYYVPSNMKYKDWKKSFVDGGSKAGLKTIKPGDIIKVKDINDCKTIPEVEDFMKSKEWFIKRELNGKVYDSNASLSLTGVDLEAAKQIFISHQEIFDKYPQLIGKLSSITTGKLGSSVYANCSFGLGSGGITVSTTKYNDTVKLAKDYADDLKSGYHPKGTDWTAIVTHELGHAIDDYLSNYEVVFGMKNSYSAKHVSATLRPKVMKSLGLKVGDTGKEVSRYATKNAQEWFAEAFAEYIKSNEPRPVAKELGRQLEEILKGVE